VRRPLPDPARWTGSDPYVVFHPGASTSSRRPTAEHSKSLVAGLVDAGRRVIITGSASEATLAAYVADGRAHDLSGQLDLPHLAAVLERASVVVAPNTGPAHLAAAVETPVVSLFAPVVPASSWAPYGVPTIILGNQEAACRDSRARICPLPDHPCLSSIRPEEVVDAVGRLAFTGVGAP
jgi:ADP-heptose:LPS heptosyltransferase